MQEIINIDTKAVERESKEITIIAEEARGLVVSNNEQYQGAMDFLRKIKNKFLGLDTLRKSITKPIDLSKERIMELFRPSLEILKQAEEITKKVALTYQQEQEKKRREDEARLQELARREEERKRKALEERAVKAEEKGNLGKAEELRQKAEEVSVPIPIIASQVPKIEGVVIKTLWKYRIIDPNLVPREYLVINEKMLQQIATATKGTLKVDGVEFYSEENISSRI